MSRFLIKLNDGKKDYYLEWSTIVDAPVTYGLSLEELKAYIKDEYGNEGMRELDQRLKRVEEHNHSLYTNESLETVIDFNRAGPKEGRLTIKGIIRSYCQNRPKS